MLPVRRPHGTTAPPRRAPTRLVAALAVAGCLAGPAAAIGPSAPVTTIEGTVSAVIDGDTVRVSVRGFDTPVRLLGIDTPETRDPRKPVQCYGPQATAMTRRLLPVGRRVIVRSDPTQATRDRYARFLGYVFRADRPLAPNRSVNHTLVRTGRAKVYVYGGVRFAAARPYFRAQNRARRAKAGLWGPPCNRNTTKPAVRTRPARVARPDTGGACDPNYAGACLPVHPPDVNCRDISARDIRVVGTDVHHLDVDRDGIACES
jgi:micrococcal nuclease